MESKPLDGRLAVITGASRGLGRAIAISLATAGARVALVSRDAAALSTVAEEVRASGAQAEVFQANIKDEDSVIRLERDVAARCGRSDILVNNAGINIRKPLVEFTLAEWDDVLSSNL